jgi:zinc protease
VQTFFRTYYTPNNAVLSVVGDIEPDDALERVAAWFGEIPPGPAVPPVAPSVHPLGGERRAILEDDVRLPRVYAGFRTPAYGQRLWYTADLLAAVLSGGKSSPLYRDLVYERQIAQDVGASVGPYECGGTFMLVATARPGVSAEELEEALLGHVAAAAAAPPDPADLERARNLMLTEAYGGLQRLDTLADNLSQFTTYFDDPAGALTEADRYLEITPDELADYAARWCTESERVVVSVVPRKAS